MDAMIVAARAVHFAAAMVVFGELLFAIVVAAPAVLAVGARRESSRAPLSLAARLGACALGASIVSGLVWFAVESALMSGLPFGQAIDARNLTIVATGTAFGRLWVWRFGVAMVLALLLAGVARSTRERAKSRFAVAALLFAAVHLVTLAWAGHAAAQGSDHDLHLVADVVHLLAAGAWVGALPGLVIELRRVRSVALGIRIARRFSILGVASVGALVGSGIGNAWYLVGDVPGLIGTPYGRLLVVKLAVFAAMMVLAAINRASVSGPSDGDEASQRRVLHALRRNASLEVAAGAIVVAIVGALGDMLPAAHQSPVWPFDRTLSWQAAQQTFGAGAAAVASGIVAIVAAGVAVAAALRARWRVGSAWLATCAVAVACCASILAVPAYPTTYAFSPTGYTTGAIVRGAALFEQDCTACHGPAARGDGPRAAVAGLALADLAARASVHPTGDVFWRIGHGMAGTSMPGFASRLDDTQIWDLVQFLRAQSDAATAAMVLGERVKPQRSAITAPDFTFERERQGQESLSDPLDESTTLLVLYTRARSLPYLRALAGDAAAAREVGLRVVALPLDVGARGLAGGQDALPDAATAQPDVAEAYALFARRVGDASDAAGSQVDYLIDRQGFIRARWIGIPDSPHDRVNAVIAQAALLSHEHPRAAAPMAHMH